jgi:hypothetical protein
MARTVGENAGEIGDNSMTPAERRAAAIKLLAELDQEIAECEFLLGGSVLEGAGALAVVLNLKLHRQWRERTEKMLAALEPKR